MYCIVVYDVNVKRVSKVHKLMKQYLFWTQNSVFTGEITLGKLKELVGKVRKIVNQDEDSVIFYTVRRDDMLNQNLIGVDKSLSTSNIIG